MKGRRHSPEQIVRKLREADRLQAEGADVDAVCRPWGVETRSSCCGEFVFVDEAAEQVVAVDAQTLRRGTGCDG
jgi:hypothetical protein